MVFDRHLESVSRVAGYLWQRGWAEMGAGNISLDISDITISDERLFKCPFDLHNPKDNSLPDGKQILVTLSGSRMRDVASNPLENLCLLRFTGTSRQSELLFLSKDKKIALPTSELPAHLAIHRLLTEKKTDRKCVLHTHCTELIALTHIPEYTNEKNLNALFESLHPEVSEYIPELVGYIDYIPPGTKEIAKQTARKLKNHRVVIWEKHGVIATGDDLDEAFDLIDVLAKAAKIYFLTNKR